MQRHWTLDDIDWARFDARLASPDLIKVIKTAAMVERNGADYGKYLCNVFRDDPAFCAAVDEWAAEEEQHGLALGRWAELADPNFSLNASFAQFLAMYQIPVDATESVRGSLGAELCARCVVETGTSSFYSAIRDTVEEPVLKQICKNIAADEFRHYRLFYDHMQRYFSGSPRERWQRLMVAITRFRETSDDEIASAYHAGNALTAPYDRVSSTDEYGARSFGFYQERHVRRAGHMFAQAAGFSPEGWMAKLLTQVLWLIIRRRGEKYRAVFAAA
ncbi:MAG: ferritin-like domain-containing protein [Rhodospirillaceae bacterium]|nr:ferritin-like domain-containing protein [Rhodospirillaceae bacterium]